MIQSSISDEELQEHLAALEKDSMVIFTAADGLFRGALFHGTRCINQMRAQHGLGLLETMVLGQGCLCAALMLQTLKGRGLLQFRYETDGPAAGFSVEAHSSGFVRGYLLEDTVPVEKPLESWDLTPFFGKGTLRITRFLETAAGTPLPPQTGLVEITHRNIAKDLTYYFLQSEQIYTAFNTGIQFDNRGRVIGAGGFFIQRMPTEGGRLRHSTLHTDEDTLITNMERAFSACPPLGQWFSEKGTCEDIVYGLLREFNPHIAAERQIVFHCPCSKDQYIRSLRNLPAPEREKCISGNTEPIEIMCRNCSSLYRIMPEEV